MTRVTISDVAMATGVSQTIQRLQGRSVQSPSPLATKLIVRASTSKPSSAGRKEVIGKNE